MGLLARQRAIEFVEEATGLLRVSVEVVLNAGLSLARPWSGCRGRVQAAVCSSMGPLAACACDGCAPDRLSDTQADGMLR
jgi:hypothetical protein